MTEKQLWNTLNNIRAKPDLEDRILKNMTARKYTAIHSILRGVIFMRPLAVCLILILLTTGFVFVADPGGIAGDIGGFFIGFFSEKSTGSLSEGQQQLIDTAAVGIGQSVTNGGLTVTVESAMGDNYTVFVKINVEAPVGCVFSKDNYYFQDYTFRKSNTGREQSDSGVTSASGAFIYLDDKDGKSNTVSIILRMSVAMAPGSNFSFSDGETRTLKLDNFCEWSDSGEVVLYEGSWSFDFECGADTSDSVELVSEPVYCRGKREGGSYEDVRLSSFELSAFGAICTYAYLNKSTSPEALLFTAEIVMLDGSVIALNPGSGTVGSFTFRLDMPISLLDTDFVRLNGDVDLPIT